ncbi:MAG: hypothetical protein WAV08_16465 [Desulfobacterales bacterium]
MKALPSSHPLKSSAADLASRILRLYREENPLLQQQVYELILGALWAFCDKADAAGACRGCGK